MKNIALILAGGKGSRLWPLSTNANPKPFLKLINNQSLLEQTKKRADIVADEAFIIIKEPVYEQHKKEIDSLGFGSHHIIIEPEDFNTAAAIAYSLKHIEKHLGTRNNLVILPADHRIKGYGSFMRDVQFAFKTARKTKKLVLFGITPTHASTSFGYIHIGSERGRAHSVQSFIEKPNKEKAEKIFHELNNVWNSGIFIGTTSSFKKLLTSNSSVKKLWLNSNYRDENLSSLVFEKSFLEPNAKKLLCVPATFDWTDLGTFSQIFSAKLDKDAAKNEVSGNVTIKDTKDSLIISVSKPIEVIGVQDIVVVETPEGLLVCKKSTHSQMVEALAEPKE